MSQQIKLNADNQYFVSEEPIDLKLDPDEPLEFISEDGKQYALIIRNAKDFLKIEKDHLTEKFLDESPKRDFKQDVTPDEYSLDIYCITDDSWPDAPPRIIVHTR